MVFIYLFISVRSTPDRLNSNFIIFIKILVVPKAVRFVTRFHGSLLYGVYGSAVL